MNTTMKAGAGRAQPNKDMTDHLHLVNQLAHHDAAISSFGSRMTAVESTLSHVQDKLQNVDSRMQSGFAEIGGLIKENKAQQGPGIVEVVKLAVSIVALGAAGAAVVTFLVTSHVEPKLQKLNDTTEVLKDFRTRDEETRTRELEQLKEMRREHVDNSIESLQQKVDNMLAIREWGPVVVQKGAR